MHVPDVQCIRLIFYLGFHFFWYAMTSGQPATDFRGTYGRVYKARIKPTSLAPTRPGDLPGVEGEIYAIKKFKPDKEGEVVTYTGISQSAAREISVRSN